MTIQSTNIADYISITFGKKPTKSKLLPLHRSNGKKSPVITVERNPLCRMPLVLHLDLRKADNTWKRIRLHPSYKSLVILDNDEEEITPLLLKDLKLPIYRFRCEIFDFKTMDEIKDCSYFGFINRGKVIDREKKYLESIFGEGTDVSKKTKDDIRMKLASDTASKKRKLIDCGSESPPKKKQRVESRLSDTH